MTRAVDDFKLDIHAVWHDAGIMKRCRRPLEEKRKTPRNKSICSVKDALGERTADTWRGTCLCSTAGLT